MWFRIVAPEQVSLALSTTSAASGAQVVGTVGGAAGSVVALASSNASVAQVPPSVTIPAGGASANFNIRAGLVEQSTTVTISATIAGSRPATAALVVHPLPRIAAVRLLSTGRDPRDPRARVVFTVQNPREIVRLASVLGVAPFNAVEVEFTMLLNAVAPASFVVLNAATRRPVPGQIVPMNEVIVADPTFPRLPTGLTRSVTTPLIGRTTLRQFKVVRFSFGGAGLPPQAPPRGTYRVTLAGDGQDAITSPQGVRLDGDAGTKLPSGNGTEGGNFELTITVT